MPRHCQVGSIRTQIRINTIDTQPASAPDSSSNLSDSKPARRPTDRAANANANSKPCQTMTPTDSHSDSQSFLEISQSGTMVRIPPRRRRYCACTEAVQTTEIVGDAEVALAAELVEMEMHAQGHDVSAVMTAAGGEIGGELGVYGHAECDDGRGKYT
ncbi:hypothetical protein IWX91DRAFT_325908 [Phyllosticta citricarpa]